MFLRINAYGVGSGTMAQMKSCVDDLFDSSTYILVNVWRSVLTESALQSQEFIIHGFRSSTLEEHRLWARPILLVNSFISQGRIMTGQE